MIDWKEENITDYLSFEHEKRSMEERMANDPIIKELELRIQGIEREVGKQRSSYIEQIRNYEKQMLAQKMVLMARWDSLDKSFKCAVGNATIRTTRSLKIRNKEELIPILQKMDKLADCITGWDISYLRKLVDVGLIKPTIANYEEKQSIIIGAVRK